MRVAQRTRPCHGETANGDRALSIVRPGETVLALVDGLGHGPLAEAAAMAAISALESAPAGIGVEAHFARAHQALRGTRGAAMTVVRIDDTQLEVAGVGNVACRSLSFSIPMLATPGIVGHSYRRLRVGHCDVPKAGRLILHSDGISSSFHVDALELIDSEGACDRLMARFAAGHDDATVLVADL
jgi:negative regulator of sigma-B (phosphoserine phosphatase)